ncbi:uncharacterized protein Z519_01945 [Cladophialophora bantiana CBS 173.52]|uniref:L-serine ammonia-lyase n=1 Tax=Cladophialophora bantiana (strain ATCC 10958 / CBS 173.52 / CDC B-1940 / NIH 8579) TaxID=1442370 RepID=A0A0D2III2_CLAB1|nr:uncharacterized protein Z519_01945 [Cladophialophora bantiana CBS 173.52]KIW96554.1 hypothetical protein Z519_01945 [Cladophialophora bantiana CBS 173.52]
MPLAETRGEIAVYIPPFNNENIREGPLTMIKQIHHQMPNGEPSDAIICSVGGGGLLAGIVQVMARVVWGSDVQILAVEQRRRNLYQLSQVVEHIIIPGLTSIATPLEVVRVCKRVFELLSRKNVTRMCPVSRSRMQKLLCELTLTG